MSEAEDLTLVLPVEDVNTILKALGRLPFTEVYAIIHKIHTQVAGQNDNREAPGA